MECMRKHFMAGKGDSEKISQSNAEGKKKHFNLAAYFIDGIRWNNSLNDNCVEVKRSKAKTKQTYEIVFFGAFLKYWAFLKLKSVQFEKWTEKKTHNKFYQIVKKCVEVSIS